MKNETDRKYLGASATDVTRRIPGFLKEISPSRSGMYLADKEPDIQMMRASVPVVTLLLQLVSAGAVLAAGSPPVVDAGPNKVLAFPAKDLSLFGHATDPENDSLTVSWTAINGPATVRFSAPWALATTVSFTATGIYTFQLSVSDGSSVVDRSVTVTVNPVTSQTAFYVDPTFSGGTGNGSAAAPWRSFEDGNPGQAAQWSAINAALASSDVIVFFSARRAGSDAAEEIVGRVHVKRTDRSTHRLTLDGMSRYNTNDASPSWADYSGASRMRIRGNRSDNNPVYFSLGWYDGDPDFSAWQGGNGAKMDYVTMRGFEVTGVAGRVTWGGSYTVLEHIWSHDVTSEGAPVQFAPAVNAYPACVDLGRSRDITLRNVVVERVIGEGVYIAGNYLLTQYTGCPAYGNTHSDLLIEGNTIRYAGQNGDEGDGIDLKAGLQNVTVRNNVIQNPYAAGRGGDGITAEGVFSGRSNLLIEGNRISGGTAEGIRMLAQNGAIVRNNLIYNMQDAGIRTNQDGGFGCTNVEIYNNTVYGNGAGITITATNDIKVVNNLVFGNNSGGSTSGSSNISSDYNLWAPSKATWSEGSNSIIQASTSSIAVNPAGGDFHLMNGSPAIDRGANLATRGFTIAFDGVIRSQGASWDIGAYEFGSGGVLPGPPTNLRIVPDTQ